MNVSILDYVGIAVYFLLVGWFAYMTRRTRTFAEFSVGNHKVPAAMIFASIAATYIGPGFSVGFTGKAFGTGYVFWMLTLTYAIQTVLVGVFFARRITQFRDCHTVGDIMETMYGKKTHFLTGIVSVALCIGLTAIMGKIAGGLLHAITGWPLTACIAAITMITAIYTFTGGIRAVIATDALQFSWFSIIVPVLLLIAVFKSPSSASGVADKAAELTKSGFAGFSGLQLFGIAVSFLLGETLMPPYVNRALAAKSGSASRTGFIQAGLYCPIWLAIVATLGIYAHQFVPANTATDDVFLVMGRMLLPGGLFGVLLAAIIAIVMSSQESVMNAGSVAVVRDLVAIKRPLSDRASLILGRTTTIVIAILATIVARYSPSIIDGLLICYSVWAPTVLLALLFGLYMKRTVHLAGLSALLFGGLASVLWQTVLKEPAGVPAILVGLACALLAYIIGHLVGSKESVRHSEGVQV